MTILLEGYLEALKIAVRYLMIILIGGQSVRLPFSFSEDGVAATQK